MPSETITEDETPIDPLTAATIDRPVAGIDPSTLRPGTEVLVLARVERIVPPDAQGGEPLVVLAIEHGLESHGRTDTTAQVVVSPSIVRDALA